MRDISPTQSPNHSRLSASEADAKDQPSANRLPELITIRPNAGARAGLALSASAPGRRRSRSRALAVRSQLGGSSYDDGFAHSSFERFFNSANARPAKRPSLVAVESSSSAWSERPASNAMNQRRKRAS